MAAMSNSNENSSSSPQSKLSVVDRSIPLTLPPEFSQTTPSSSLQSADGIVIPPRIELLHRLHGTALLFHASTLLRLSASIYATSTTLFHRFYHRRSLSEFDLWSTCMACTVLACKIEEEPKRLKDVVLIYVHLYRRFKLGLYSTTETIIVVEGLKTAQSIIVQREQPDDEEKENILRYIRPMVETDDLYQQWEGELVKMENVILRELGFSLYWIPESHPHVFLLYFLKVLEVEDDGNNDNGGDIPVGQIAWNYCNDSCRLDLCVRYPPEVTACAAIYLACLQRNIHLPQTPRPWWQVFIGPERDDDLSTTCNAILALGDEHCIDGFSSVMRKFVVSLVMTKATSNGCTSGSGESGGGSFNDPGTVVWNAFDEH